MNLNIDIKKNNVSDILHNMMKLKTKEGNREVYGIEEVLNHFIDPTTVKGKALIDFDGDLMKMNSHRLWTFKFKGIVCVNCHLKALFFKKDKNFGDKRYHFNLYGIDKDGNRRLFTKDHIHPHSQGGKDHIDNYQTMCTVCNKEKGHLLPDEWNEIKNK